MSKILRGVVKGIWRLISWPFRHWRAVFILLIVLAIAHTILDQMLLRKLAQQREDIRAGGGMMSLYDLDIPALDKKDNAAVLYRKADEMIIDVYEKFAAKHGDGSISSLDALRLRLAYGMIPEPLKNDYYAQLNGRRERLPLSDEDIALLMQLAERLQPPMDIVKEAQERDSCVFGNYEPSTLAENMPNNEILVDLSAVRTICQTSLCMAYLEQRQGNVQSALEWITVSLRLANDLRNDPIILVCSVRNAMVASSLRALQILLYNNDLPDSVPSELFEQLQMAADREIMARFIAGENAFMQTLMKSDQYRIPGRLLRPIFWTPGYLKLNEMTDLLRRATADDDYSIRQTILEPVNGFYDEAKRMGHWNPRYLMARIIIPNLDTVFLSGERTITQANLARVSMALKRYKRDTFAYPDRLEVLVPEYLDAVPQDTFAEQPLQYAHKGDGCWVYSVGPDGIDDSKKQGSVSYDKDIVWATIQ